MATHYEIITWEAKDDLQKHIAQDQISALIEHNWTLLPLVVTSGPFGIEEYVQALYLKPTASLKNYK